jgi:hypothetical protein
VLHNRFLGKLRGKPRLNVAACERLKRSSLESGDGRASAGATQDQFQTGRLWTEPLKFGALFGCQCHGCRLFRARELPTASKGRPAAHWGDALRRFMTGACENCKLLPKMLPNGRFCLIAKRPEIRIKRLK